MIKCTGLAHLDSAKVDHDDLLQCDQLTRPVAYFTRSAADRLDRAGLWKLLDKNASDPLIIELILALALPDRDSDIVLDELMSNSRL